MLGRRHFRIKVLQGLYAYFQGGEPRIEVAEKNLLISIEKTIELYYLQWSFFLEVIDFYERRQEDARHKFLPTEEELNPSAKLLDNRVVHQLRENQDLKRRQERYKFNWSDDQEIVRRTWQKIRDSKDHLEYLHSGVSSYEEDRLFAEKLFKKFIARSHDLQYYCDERSIYWADDFDWAASFVLKSLKMIDQGFGASDPLTNLFAREEDDDPAEDHQFTVDLFRKTIIHSTEYEKLIEERTHNWEIDRIALTDIILIKMALTELIHFSNIPVKVTLNEYIELSKYFSSLKSKHFINGILDKLVIDLQEEKKIRKTGRGLMT